ncbi:MAG TPA: PKD domain-containing protein [Thermoplasmata archaeon]|nr:PKD domain-containing protein [Thermoplasmata archaeon]
MTLERHRIRPSRRFRATSAGIGIVLVSLLGASSGLSTAASAPGFTGPSATSAVTGSANPCGIVSGSTHLHDLVVESPNLTSLYGQWPRFFAVLPAGAVGVSYLWWFGDGGFAVSHSPEVRHPYATPGTYAVCATALDATGHIHDSRAHLLEYVVLPSTVGDPAGVRALLTGSIASNSSTGTLATPYVAPGGSVTVRVTDVLPPSNDLTREFVPRFSESQNAVGFGTLSAPLLQPNGTSSVRIGFGATTPPGFYELNYTLPTKTLVGVNWSLAWSNYTFTIVVGSGLGGLLPPRSASGHHGTLRVVEYAPGGAASFDPAIDYEPAGAEAMANVYQTLILANGSATGRGPVSFEPDLATCVPGSGRCISLYGNSLARGDNLTFVINNRSAFYDPATGASWGVWPTDVLFSLIRTMALANSPCWECNGGWMVSQGLLPAGSYSWDGAAHLPVNNTPRWMYGSITLNASGLCPKAAMAAGQRGCVTLQFPHTSLSPGFRTALEVLASPVGASIVSCGWFSAAAQGLGIPYWTLGNVSGAGDAPCAAPGSSGYGVAVSTVPATGFDSWELNGSIYPSHGRALQAMVGSGPYYLARETWGVGYVLRTNPSWSTVAVCTAPGCLPAKGAFVPQVNVTWATTPGAVQAAIVTGSSDLATLPPNGTTMLVSDVTQGLVGIDEFPSLTTYFDPLNLWSNATRAAGLAGQNLTAPSTLLDDVNLRQFLVHAFPYDSAMTYAFGVAGLSSRFLDGGAIPQFLGPSTPQGIAWPSGNPDTNPADVGGAAWWWNQTAHDPMVGPVCTPLSPCSFLVTYPTNATAAGQSDKMWVASIESLSNRSLLPVLRNESAARLTADTLYSGPGGLGPFVTTGLSAAVDYADPSDSVDPLYLPDTFYTASSALAERLQLFNATNCSTSLGYWANSTSPIPNSCQGAAYASMVVGIHQADTIPPGPRRGVLYGQIETVANDLALYLYAGQRAELVATAPWISIASVDPSPLTGIAHGMQFSFVRYLTGPGAPLSVRGPFVWSTPATLGAPLNLTALAVGGAGGYQYTWSGLPGGCAALPVAVLTCVPNQTGLFRLSVTVVDATGHNATAPLALVVADHRRRVPRPTRGRPRAA